MILIIYQIIHQITINNYNVYIILVCRYNLNILRIFNKKNKLTILCGILSAKRCHILLINTKTTFLNEIMVTTKIYSKNPVLSNMYNTL